MDVTEHSSLGGVSEESWYLGVPHRVFYAFFLQKVPCSYAFSSARPRFVDVTHNPYEILHHIVVVVVFVDVTTSSAEERKYQRSKTSKLVLTQRQVWALSETLQSDWALEMAKSVTVEMIRSTKATPGGNRQKQSPSSPPVTNNTSEDAEGDEVPAGNGRATFGSGGSAPDGRPGVLVNQLEEGGGDGEVRKTVRNES